MGSARGMDDLRQLAEKAIEHRAQQFLIFVDLKKAYNSVPREALWVAMQKLGVPGHLIDICKVSSSVDGGKSKG